MEVRLGTQRALPTGVLPGLLATHIRKVLVGPVDFEAGGEDEKTQLLEAHVAENGKSRADVGAVVHGAAAAVDDEIGGAGERGGPGFDLTEAISGAALAVELRAFDVTRGEQTLETDKQNGGRGLGVGEFSGQSGGLDGLRVGPRVSGILSVHIGEKETKRHQRENGTKKYKRKTARGKTSRHGQKNLRINRRDSLAQEKTRTHHRAHREQKGRINGFVRRGCESV